MLRKTDRWNAPFAPSGLDIEWITVNAENKLAQDQISNETLFGQVFTDNINNSVVVNNTVENNMVQTENSTGEASSENTSQSIAEASEESGGTSQDNTDTSEENAGTNQDNSGSLGESGETNQGNTDTSGENAGTNQDNSGSSGESEGTNQDNTDTSGENGGTSQDNSGSSEESGETNQGNTNTSGENGGANQDNTETPGDNENTDTGEDGTSDDASGKEDSESLQGKTLVLNCSEVEYVTGSTEYYPTYIRYTNDKSETVKIGLGEGQPFTYDTLLQNNDLIDDFKISVHINELLDDECVEQGFAGNGSIDKFIQISDNPLTVTGLIVGDEELILSGQLTIQSVLNMRLGAKVTAKDIVLGTAENQGTLDIVSGSLVADNIRSENGKISLHYGEVELSGQIINNNKLYFANTSNGDANLSCDSLINNGECTFAVNSESGIIGISEMTIVNSSYLIMSTGSGAGIKRLQNLGDGFFEGSGNFSVSDGIVIGSLQSASDNPVYLSGNTASPVTGTFEGECKLTYDADINAYLMETSDSGDSSDDDVTGGEDTLTGEITAYSGSEITLKNSTYPEGRTFALSSTSLLASGLNNCGLFSDFDVTVKEGTDGKYTVTDAVQNSNNAISIVNRMSLTNEENLTIKGECTVASQIYLYENSTINFQKVNIITADSRGWIQAEDNAKVSAEQIYVKDGILWFNSKSTLEVASTIEVEGDGDEAGMDLTYGDDVSIGEFEIILNSGSTIISKVETTTDEVFKNVSIVNNSELDISDTTVKSLTGSGILTNDGGGLVILNS